jgi:SAM-dependent methyltransferase
MSVSAHLGITVAEYDARIPTFIPHYHDLLDAAASLVPPRTRTILDLGIGTGALAKRCLQVARRAHVTGIDADSMMLAVAKRRLGKRVSGIHGDFESSPYPLSDVVVSAFALHHVRTRAAKVRLYRRVRSALRPGGLLVNTDCCPASDAAGAARQRLAWRDHLRETYSPMQAAGYLRSWARDDVYMPLGVEVDMMQAAGFHTEVAWRRDAFAVLLGRKMSRNVSRLRTCA